MSRKKPRIREESVPTARIEPDLTSSLRDGSGVGGGLEELFDIQNPLWYIRDFLRKG